MVAFNQKDFLDGVIGDPAYYKVCKAMFPCGSPNSSTKGMDGFLDSNFEKAKALLKEAGYDGTPVVLMQSTDLAVLTNLAPVAKNLMEKAGFKVDMQSMDWQTLVARRAKKDPPAQGGWHAFLTSWVAADILNPVRRGLLQRLAATRPCSAGRATRRSRALRDQYARETNPGQAQGHRRGGAGARDAVSDARLAGAVVRAGRGAEERERHDRGAGHRLLEHREEGRPSQSARPAGGR